MATETSIVTRTDFVTVPTKDFEAAAKFYGETLGLPCSVRYPNITGAEYETGNLTLSLLDPTNVGMEYHVNHNPIALHVEDMESARAELESRGVKFNGDTFDTGVCYMSFFADPDGNALMLHQRYAPREG